LGHEARNSTQRTSDTNRKGAAESGALQVLLKSRDPDSNRGASFGIVFVTMRQGDRDTVAEFEDAVAAVPAVVSAQGLFGDRDYLLHVAAADLAAYQRIYDEHSAHCPVCSA
jgi:DNA-binding Lrp family transcriptional regulator